MSVVKYPQISVEKKTN